MLTSIGLAVIVFAAYWLAVELAKRSGVLERYNITAYGPVLLIRTKKGLGFLEKLARWRRFWKVLADLGLPAVFLGMAFMFALLLYADYIMVTNPPKPSILTSPRAALLIPGINPFIPIVWGTIGLIVTLVVHEFSHAILCRVEGVSVKSLGVILALIPFGGFAEPDESELMDKKKTSRAARVRIFSAGVIVNFVVAAVAFATFVHLLGMLQPLVVIVGDNGTVDGVVLEVNGQQVRLPEDVYEAVKGTDRVYMLVSNESGVHELVVPNVMGVKVVGLYREDSKTFPAEQAGMKEGMVIVEIDGEAVRNHSDFQRIMSKMKPGQNVTVRVYHNGSFEVYNVTLTDMNGRGFLGVYVQLFDCIDGISIAYSGNLLQSLRSTPQYLTSVAGWLYLISMPFRFQGFMSDYAKLFEAPEWVFWVLNTLYWIGWINFYVGLFNCLPAIPLDGGRVFHEAFSYLLARRYGDRAEEISMRIVKTFAFIVFFSILLSIAVPNLEGLI